MSINIYQSNKLKFTSLEELSLVQEYDGSDWNVFLSQKARLPKISGSFYLARIDDQSIFYLLDIETFDRFELQYFPRYFLGEENKFYRKGLFVDVYRDSDHHIGLDCTIDGVSSRYTRLLLSGASVDEVNQTYDLDSVVDLLVRSRGYLSVKPCRETKSLSSGGNFIFSVDSRFRAINPYPIPVHDRDESKLVTSSNEAEVEPIRSLIFTKIAELLKQSDWSQVENTQACLFQSKLGSPIQIRIAADLVESNRLLVDLINTEAQDGVSTPMVIEDTEASLRLFQSWIKSLDQVNSWMNQAKGEGSFEADSDA